VQCYGFAEFALPSPCTTAKKELEQQQRQVCHVEKTFGFVSKSQIGAFQWNGGFRHLYSQGNAL
jgi:hypothetical protein